MTKEHTTVTCVSVLDPLVLGRWICVGLAREDDPASQLPVNSLSRTHTQDLWSIYGRKDA
jgi:hypothetical protein